MKQLYCHRGYVLHPLTMAHRGPALPLKLRTTCGTLLLDHLGLAEVAGLAGGQVAVAAVLEVHADLIGV